MVTLIAARGLPSAARLGLTNQLLTRGMVTMSTRPPRSKVAVYSRVELGRHAPKRHFWQQILQRGLQLLIRRGAIMLPTALPVIAIVFVTRILPILGLACTVVWLLGFWEGTAFVARVWFTAVTVGAVLFAGLYSVLMTHFQEEAEAELLPQVDAFFGCKCEVATDKPILPDWKNLDEPVILEPCEFHFNLHNGSLQMTYKWAVDVKPENTARPRRRIIGDLTATRILDTNTRRWSTTDFHLVDRRTQESLQIPLPAAAAVV